MHKFSGLNHAPLFVPAVGDFEQGMVVQVPLPLWSLAQPPTGEKIYKTIAQHFEGEPFVKVMSYADNNDLRDENFFVA